MEGRRGADSGSRRLADCRRREREGKNRQEKTERRFLDVRGRVFGRRCRMNVRGRILDWDFCFEHERGTFWLVAAV